MYLFVPFLVLQSSGWGRESWLIDFNRNGVFCLMGLSWFDVFWCNFLMVPCLCLWDIPIILARSLVIVVVILVKLLNVYCYMTPLKDLLWLAETSLHWLWQILMSNIDELKTGNITDRELNTDWTRSSPGDIKFCHCYLRAKNRYCNTDWFLMYISQVKCFNSEFDHFMRTAFNPFMPNGISHCYQLEQSISVLRGVSWYFSILFKF